MSSESDNFKSNLVALFCKPCMVNNTQVVGTIVGFLVFSDDQSNIIVRVKGNDGEYYEVEYDEVSILSVSSINDFIKSLDDTYKQCDNFIKASNPIAPDLLNESSDTRILWPFMGKD